MHTTWINPEHRVPSKMPERQRSVYLNEVSRKGQFSSTECGSMVPGTVGRQRD